MATILKNIVRFTGLAVGVPAALPHLLNVNGIAVTPKTVQPNTGGYTIAANTTNVTVTRTADGAADVDVLVEYWHSIESVVPLVPPPGKLVGKVPWIQQPGAGGGGGGGSIIVEDEGVVVPGGPHTTLNFTGAGVAVTDAGSGVAAVAIPGGGGSSYPAPATSFDYLEDFFGGITTTGPNGGDWTLVKTGAATISIASSQLPYIGLAIMVMNANNDTAYVYVGNHQIQVDGTKCTQVFFEWAGTVDLNPTAINDFTARYLACSNVVPTYGAADDLQLGFSLGFGQNGNANWWGVLGGGSKIDLGFANDFNYHRFRVVYTPGVGVEWFIDGVLLGTILGTPPVDSPGNNMLFCGMNCVVAPTGGAAPDVDADYMWIHMDLPRP